MSSRETNNLSRQRIHQLLSAVGSDPAEDIAQVDFTEYDWNCPHYFNDDQLVKLDGFVRRAAQAMVKRFSDFCRSRFDVTITSITQHFAGEYLDKALAGEQKDFFVLFGTTPERPCGFIGIPESTAGAWARQLLGDSEPQEGSTRELSSLEESLLIDLMSALIEAFSESEATFNFGLTGNLIKGMPPLSLSATEELCRVSFDVKKADSEKSSTAYLVILCSELTLATGKAVRAADGFSANEISKAIVDHLQEMTVSVTAQLDTIPLTFEEVANLQVNDMLLLDRTVDEPIELVLNDRPIFSGRPAKSAGKYAVVITAMSNGDAA
ncbi:MAG: FliM/FliN family flagellar motor switch protein [Phycisphaerales bacterium]|nr:MAG: FliM/FliN family flagellar motor switch protein [Phycisphaerales bacterium]